MKNSRVSSESLLKEKGIEHLASRYHRYYTFTLAIVHCCRLELVFPPCAAVHTTCSHSRSKYTYEKMFRWRNIFVVEQYSRNKFSDNEYHLKIFPLRKKDNDAISYTWQPRFQRSYPYPVSALEIYTTCYTSMHIQHLCSN